LVHVVGAAAGISVLAMASAQAFTVLKTIGAFYLLWLGGKTLWQARVELPINVESAGARRAFRVGIIVEALNPKTAAFFLAFILQFVDPSHRVAMQFVLLGSICVFLNTAADVAVVYAVAKARSRFDHRPRLIKRVRQCSGLAMGGLGASLLLVRRSN
jgi:threonine/homoserine/homoserine lactone efflux protein